MTSQLWIRSEYVVEFYEDSNLFDCSRLVQGLLITLIPPNSRILRVGIFGNVSLEPRVFSTKSGFQTRYLLNNKNSELENSASLEPRFREGLVYYEMLWKNNFTLST